MGIMRVCVTVTHLCLGLAALQHCLICYSLSTIRTAPQVLGASSFPDCVGFQFSVPAHITDV